jgi:hypothetical protein
MSSDYDVSDASAGSHSDVHENSTDQDSVTSGSDGLVPSDGSHMGSVSVNSIDPDSITDPLADGFVDQPQQERGGGGLNLAVDEILSHQFSLIIGSSEVDILSLPLDGAQETAEFMLDATTNLEGGKECRYKVREDLLLDRCGLHFANEFLLWFLEAYDSFGTSTVRMPPEAPC